MQIPIDTKIELVAHIARGLQRQHAGKNLPREAAAVAQSARDARSIVEAIAASATDLEQIAIASQAATDIAYEQMGFGFQIDAPAIAKTALIFADAILAEVRQ